MSRFSPSPRQRAFLLALIGILVLIVAAGIVMGVIVAARDGLAL